MSEKQKNTVLISHRLRGFDVHDASLNGLLNALSKGLTHFEVDCRVTQDGEIVIHHDAKLGKDFSEQPYIADKTLAQLKEIHYADSSGTILTLEELFESVRQYKNVTLYLDIKESGKEELILNKAAEHNLLNNIVIISWLPEVLFKVNELLPEMQLCFSFYPVCNNRASRINFMQTRFQSMWRHKTRQRLTWLFNNYNNENQVTGQYGFDFEHFVSLPLGGKLFDVLQSVNGIVCVNHGLIDNEFVYTLNTQGLRLCLYSLNTRNELQFSIDKFHPDFILTDNASLLL